MRNTNATNGTGTVTSCLVYATGLLLLYLLCVAPSDSIRPIVESEWNNSSVAFGSWIASSVHRIYDIFCIDSWLQGLTNFGDVNRSKSELEIGLDNWLLERADVFNLLVILLLLRIVTLVGWGGVFVPAILISLLCGWWQREENKDNYFFTSPYRTTKWSYCIKFCLIGLVAVVLCPIEINVWVMPLFLFALVFLSEKIVSSLQKEI